MDSTQVDFLIVDDSRDAADSLAAVFEALGHGTYVAYTAREALDAVHRIKPLCVMLDISMPDMDGLELAREMRRQYGDDVVLVAVTGHSADDPRVAATFAIVDHYFQKPVSPEVLLRILVN